MPTIISEWIYCPVCGNKTRTMIREDRELKNFPLYCPKCKQETIFIMVNGWNGERHFLNGSFIGSIRFGHTHVQGSFSHAEKILLNSGSVGVSLYSGGKAQFMILYQNGEELGHQFISLDYDKKKVIKEMEESGLCYS